MAQQTTRKAGIGGLFPRALVLGLALGLLLFPFTGLRSSLVLDSGSEAAVYASSRTGFELGIADAGTTSILACPDDMIAYWKLDELNGNNGYEDSFDNHDGVCGAKCPFGDRPGKVGRSQKFSSGDTREIDVPASTDFDWAVTDDWTVSVWARRPVGEMANNEPIIGRDYSPSNTDPRHWWLGILGRGTNTGKVVFYAIDNDKSDTGDLMGDAAILDNVWHHLVVVRDGAAGRLYLYVDGELQDEDATAYTSGFASPKELNIGWINFGATPLHFDGYIDEVALYGRALGRGEIEDHYYAGWADKGYCSNPTLSVNKLANPETIYAGDTVNYTYLLSNPGDVGFEGVTVADDKCAGMSLPSGDNGNGILDPGSAEVWTYTCGMAVSQDTINTATASGTYTYPVDATLTATGTATVNVLAPTVNLVKVPDNDAVYAGDTVTYDYTVTNTSNDTLTNVTVVDDKCSPVAQQTGDGTLSGGEVQTYRCSVALIEDTTNTATLTGRDELGRVWTFSGTATVDVIAPDVQIVKTASPTTIYRGDTVNYTYVVTNNGDDELSSVNLTDDKCAPVRLVGSNDGKLQPGETLNYACSTTLTGNTTNIGAFTGRDLLGKTWTFTDTASVRVLGPQIAVAKTVDKPVIYAGTAVRYDYDVTNPGDDPLSNVQLADDKCSPNLTGGDANGNSKLDPGETWTYWCQSGPLTVDTTNTAIAGGIDSKGSMVTSPPVQVTVDVINPNIGLDKTAVERQINPGDTAVYRYVVTNTGDDPLSNVTVTDDKCSSVTLISGDTNRNLKLEVSETWTFGCSMVLTKNTTNTAVARGVDSAGGTVSASDTATVRVEALIYLPFVRRP